MFAPAYEQGGALWKTLKPELEKLIADAAECALSNVRYWPRLCENAGLM
jgi:hypothetical protein